MNRPDIQQLYRAHHGWMKNLLVRKLRCPEDAADLAQDAFERLLRKPLSFDNVMGGRHYLSRIAHSLCIDLWRRRQIEQAYMESLALLAPECIPDVAEQQVIIDVIVKVDQLLSRLPRKIKRTFIAVQIEGLTYQQVAERDKISIGSVKNYLAQAIVRLTSFREEHHLD
ncbi:sigma-70 family RNA polymerase sigma factor [Bowmanella yangjiangensis]|uniref:Sigma-70 family RNA polymerase sigma factor n=1 Tax=Bowmanella yangjiangensis TaxID=2811230 RepID=A0ABS3CY80_9ALTE|nr:sigma-70 family RNA polymerase sigma factor [Bowmanella yangjiangensis]MBN7820584.1 sigma-70 family RNA polymerase sigma factor [Bowmanella yangjiangensis]